VVRKRGAWRRKRVAPMGLDLRRYPVWSGQPGGGRRPDIRNLKTGQQGKCHLLSIAAIGRRAYGFRPSSMTRVGEGGDRESDEAGIGVNEEAGTVWGRLGTPASGGAISNQHPAGMDDCGS
jgi:hypothetical protein